MSRKKKSLRQALGAFSTLWVAALVAVAAFSVSTVNLKSDNLKADLLPVGYVPNYAIRISTPVPMVYVKLTHQSGGDLLYISRSDADGNCGNDNVTVQVVENGYPAETRNPSFVYSNGTCATSGNGDSIGRSIYRGNGNPGEYPPGISVVQGTINMSVYPSISSAQTSWTIEAAGTAEVKVSSTPPVCTEVALSMDKSSFNYGEFVMMRYSCLKPETSSYFKIPTFKIEAVSPTGVVVPLIVLTDTATGSHTASSDTLTPKAGGQWSFRTCFTTTQCTPENSKSIAFTMGTPPVEACTGFNLSTDKSSYNMGETVKVYYSCAYPASGVASQLTLELLAPGNTELSAIPSNSTVISNATSGSYEFQSWAGGPSKISGQWMVRSKMQNGSTNSNFFNVNAPTTTTPTTPTTPTTTTTTPTTTTPTTTTPTTTTSGYVCEQFEENGLSCSRCSQNGVESSKSCWKPMPAGTTGTAYPQNTRSEYYMEGEKECMKSFNDAGAIQNLSCWKDDASTQSTGWNDPRGNFSRDNVTCEMRAMANASPLPNGPTPMCEVCKKPDGSVVQDYCGNSGGQPSQPGQPGQPGQPSQPGESCTWNENEKGEQCKICSDENGRVVSDVCEGQPNQPGDGNIAEGKEASRQLGDMFNNVKNWERDFKEFGRFNKRIERKIKEYERKIKFIEEDMDWMERDGLDVDGLEEAIGKIEDVMKILQGFIAPANELAKKAESNISNVKNYLNELSRSQAVTWDQLDIAWLIMRRWDLIQLEREVFDFKVNFYEMVDGYYEWEKEKAKMLAQFERDGIRLNDEQHAMLEEGEAWIEDMRAAYDEVLEAGEDTLDVAKKAPNLSPSALTDKDVRDEYREFFDFDLRDAWDNLRWVREDYYGTQQDQRVLWETLDDIRRVQEIQRSLGWMGDELKLIREEIGIFAQGLSVLDGKLDSYNQKRSQEVQSIFPKAKILLSEIEKAIEDVEGHPFEIEEATRGFWDSLDRLGGYVDPRLGDIVNYVEEHRQEWNLSSDDNAVVQELINRVRQIQSEDEFHGGCGDKCGRLYEVYGTNVADILGEKIKAQIVDQLVQTITASVMEQVSRFLEQEISGKIYEAIMNNFDKLKGDKVGEDFGSKLLENGTAVTEQIQAVNVEEVNNEELHAIYDDFQRLPMPNEELAIEVKDYFEEMQAAVERGDDEADLQVLVEEGKELYDRAEEAKYEAHLGFRDVPYIFDENYDAIQCWYCEDVVTGALNNQWGGYKNAEGELTYNFGPSDQTLRAEALKMVLSAFGYEPSGSGEQWWAGWANTGRQLGASLADQDLSRPVTRGEVMRLIFEIGKFDAPSQFNAYFPDVSTRDDWIPAETMFEAGIFKGDGDTGNARIYATLNRAESAAVINRAMQWAEGETFAGEELLSRLESKSGEGENFFAMLGQVLKTLLPVW